MPIHETTLIRFSYNIRTKNTIQKHWLSQKLRRQLSLYM